MPARGEQARWHQDNAQLPWAKVIARRYQAHPPGFVYVILTVLLVLGAVNSQNNLLFAIFGLAVAGIIVSGIVSGAAIMGLRVRREIVGPAQAGGQARVVYHVRNTNWLIPSAGLVIEEVEVDRRGRHRSSWKTHLAPLNAFVPWVRAHDEVAVEARAAAHQRGVPSLNLIRLSTTFPFGLTKKYVLFSQSAQIVVRPWVAPMPKRPLIRASGEAPGSRTFRPSRSSGGEFFSIRDYTKGDNPRAIAWRATARRGHLVVRENADREHRRLHLEIETGSLTGESLERFVSAVAGFAASELGSDVELAMKWGDTVVGSGSGPRQRIRILDALALVPSVTSRSERDSSSTQPRAPGRMTVRSRDGGDAVILASSDLISACEDWSAFPAPVSPPPPRGVSKALSELARQVRSVLLPAKGGTP